MLDYGKLEALELQGGRAALSALSKLSLNTRWTPLDSSRQERERLMAGAFPAYSSLDFDVTATGSD